MLIWVTTSVGYKLQLDYCLVRLRFLFPNWFSSIAMPSHAHRYNHIDDALRSWIIHSIFNEGLPYVDTCELYGYPYETIRSIAQAFEENSQLLPKDRGGVHYPILQDEHIQWLVERLEVDPNITVESIHRGWMKIFNSHAMYLSLVFHKPFEVKLDLPSSWCDVD